MDSDSSEVFLQFLGHLMLSHDSKDAVLEGAELLFAWFFPSGNKKKTPPVCGCFDQSKSEQWKKPRLVG